MKPTKGLMAKQFDNDYTFPTEFHKWAEDKKVHEIIATDEKITIFFTV